MYMSKINQKTFWGVNLLLFIGVVFLGIEQAGRGADISNLEDQLEIRLIEKREIAENIFNSGNEIKLSDNAINLGYSKPSKVYYLDPIDSVASLK